MPTTPPRTSEWSLIPDCPIYKAFALAVINGRLTTVGGFGDENEDNNRLFSLTGAGEDGEKTWIKEFPPMPTKRFNVSTLCIGTALVIVGSER